MFSSGQLQKDTIFCRDKPSIEENQNCFECRDPSQCHTVRCDTNNCREMNHLFLGNMQYAVPCADSSSVAEEVPEAAKRSRNSEMKEFALHLTPTELMKLGCSKETCQFGGR